MIATESAHAPSYIYASFLQIPLRTCANNLQPTSYHIKTFGEGDRTNPTRPEKFVTLSGKHATISCWLQRLNALLNVSLGKLYITAFKPHKSTQVFNLCSTCVPFGRLLALTSIDLQRLAWTLIEQSNSHASRRKFLTVWPPNASRHKGLIASHLYMREMYGFLRERASGQIRLATPRKSAR